MASKAKKKPVKKASGARKTVVKKPAAKKAAPKASAKKPMKPSARKPAPAKKTVKKAAAKKPVKQATKPAAKAAKKSAPTKARPAQQTPKLSIVPQAKKPLAPAARSAVKPTAATNRITPIKAPAPVAASSATMKKNMTSKTTPNKNSRNYEPKDSEDFMNPVMKEYFRNRLLEWREELLRESGETLHILQEEGNMQKPDITDRASEETDLAIEFRTRDRERKLLNKINEALQRIEDGTYGYCEETGDAIPVKRLIARPTATMTLEAQELHERRERTQRDTYE